MPLINLLKNMTIRKFPRLHLFNGANSKYFKESGWYRSFLAKAPVDKEGKPQPWLSIGANRFLGERLQKRFTIFEYGSGNSTLYYSERVNAVISVEHDKNWYSKIESNMPKNVTLQFQALEGDQYENYIKTRDERFHLIIVDGRKRLLCAEAALGKLDEDGVIIFDDFDRIEYQAFTKTALDHKFKKIEFWGMSPGSSRFKSTAFFYKEGNCLGI